MLNPQLRELAQRLKLAGKHITIETSGIAYVSDLPCDLMSISPKLSNSIPDDEKLKAIHEDFRLDFAVLDELIDHYNYQLKFVVDDESDIAEIKETIEHLWNVNPEKVMLMPQASTRNELIQKSPIVAELCKRIGYTFSERLQILIWNNQRGK